MAYRWPFLFAAQIPVLSSHSFPPHFCRMKLYHGTDNPQLEINEWIPSRYGITSFFATPDRELAERYARHARLRRGKGFLYQLEARPTYRLDWRNRTSYSAGFRNMVFNHARAGTHGAILVENVIDYPDSEQVTFLPTSVVVIYDVSLISHLNLIKKI